MYLFRQSRFSRWSKGLFIGILCLGIFFRFVNLDKKVFWVDEVATALRVSGYTMQEMAAELVDGPAQTPAQLQKYQYPSPEKNLADTAASLAAEDVHPPLFFSLLRGWVSLFGNSVVALRSLAACFSVLMFPAVWWLCKELFNPPLTRSTLAARSATNGTARSTHRAAYSNPVGWVAVALLALSPAQVVYAQESRQYTLWMLIMLLAGASLLRSLRINRWQSWLLYSILMTLGLYTHYLFMLVIASHGLYVLCTERLKPTRKFISYLIATAITGAAYLPWILFSSRFSTDTTQLSWMDQPPKLLSMVVQIAGVLSRSFVDFGVGTISGSIATLVVAPLLLFSIAISLLAVIVLVRQTPFKTWFFVATFGGVTAAVVLGSYFVLDKAVATTRFVLPISLSLQLAVAYLLVTGIQRTQPYLGKYVSQPIVWRTLGGLLLSLGALSCALRLNAPVWWTQMPYLNQDIPAIAQSIDQQDNALVIVDASKNPLFFDMVQPQSLLHSLHPVSPNAQVQLQIVEKAVPDLKSASGQNTFIYLPIHISGMQGSPDTLKAEMAGRYGVSLEPVVPGVFWRVSQSVSG